MKTVCEDRLRVLVETEKTPRDGTLQSRAPSFCCHGRQEKTASEGSDVMFTQRGEAVETG